MLIAVKALKVKTTQSNIRTLINFTIGQRIIYNDFKKKTFYIIMWSNPFISVKMYFASLDAI